MMIEPAAILEPGYALLEGWADDMRRRHDASLAQPWTAFSSVALFEMNASFHEGIAAGSGNGFFVEAVRRQNRLRRFANCNWRLGAQRVRANHTEHMAILDPLEAGDRELAALMMRRHLHAASGWRLSTAG
jgi:DNA-binding GntR family transcriptional regulator